MERLAEMWARGATRREIGAAIGMSVAAVRHWRRKLGLAGRAAGRARSVLDAPTRERFIAACAAGRTGHEIAAEFAITRAAVWRQRAILGLTKHIATPRRPNPRRPDPRQIPREATLVRLGSSTEGVSIFPTPDEGVKMDMAQPAAEKAAAPIGPSPAGFGEIGAARLGVSRDRVCPERVCPERIWECGYVTSDGPPWTFCGKPTNGRDSLCPDCRARCSPVAARRAA